MITSPMRITSFLSSIASITICGFQDAEGQAEADQERDRHACHLLLLLSLCFRHLYISAQAAHRLGKFPTNLQNAAMEKGFFVCVAES